MANLKDRVALITGAGSGIGYQTALSFAREGAKVAVADRREERVQELADRIAKSGGEALAIAADVSKREDVRRMVQATMERFGRIDVLVNNAGYALGASIEDTTERDFQELWETNVMGVPMGMQEALPVLPRPGSGHIIHRAPCGRQVAH